MATIAPPPRSPPSLARPHHRPTACQQRAPHTRTRRPPAWPRCRRRPLPYPPHHLSPQRHALGQALPPVPTSPGPASPAAAAPSLHKPGSIRHSITSMCMHAHAASRMHLPTVVTPPGEHRWGRASRASLPRRHRRYRRRRRRRPPLSLVGGHLPQHRRRHPLPLSGIHLPTCPAPVLRERMSSMPPRNVNEPLRPSLYDTCPSAGPHPIHC